MKRLLLVCLMCLAVSGLSTAEDISGPLSGTLGPGSYDVVDSIYVAAAQSLTIAPGTTFNFIGAFGFGIAGELQAIGTESDSIKFIPVAGVPFWSGMQFTAVSSNNCRMEYCLVSGSNDMGIFLDHAPAVAITHCAFTNNSSAEMGGGIYCYYSNSSISNSVFAYNTALHGGGLVIRYSTPTLVDNLIFYGNSGTYGGAMAQYFSSNFTMSNCLFYQNSGNAGAGVRLSSSPSILRNCTFTENEAGQGSAIFIINQVPTIINNIIWGNTGDPNQLYVYAGGVTCTYSDVEGGFTGVGNINSDPLFVAGPDGNYYLSQIAAGQMMDSPCMDAGDPASPMIIGTTRTDGVQDAEIVDMGYHYAVGGAPPPPVTITLLPDSLPILIPPSGGSFGYLVTLMNNTTSPQGFDAWIMVQLPNGSWWGPALGPVSITLPGGNSVERNRMQSVPAGAPAGDYLYEGRVGIYPDTVYDSDSFSFTKLEAGDAGVLIPNWSNTGQSFEDKFTSANSVPDNLALYDAFPNPFNPTTTLAFDLPQAALVKLLIRDVSGRLVANPVNGWRDAGRHEITFDASDLASGIYIYTLETAGLSASGKMILLK